jgi:DNA-binding SARP family transcriptional activator
MALAPGSADSASIRLYLFGEFQLERQAGSIHLPTRKAELLLAYLALSPGPHGREKLAALFWGDVPDEQARGSLRKALTALRQALGPDVLLTGRQAVRLNPDYPLWVDVATFERLAGRRPFPYGDVDVQSESAMLDLYRGDLLNSFYEDWIAPLREQYRAAYLERVLALCTSAPTST